MGGPSAGLLLPKRLSAADLDLWEQRFPKGTAERSIQFGREEFIFFPWRMRELEGDKDTLDYWAGIHAYWTYSDDVDEYGPEELDAIEKGFGFRPVSSCSVYSMIKDDIVHIPMAQLLLNSLMMFGGVVDFGINMWPRDLPPELEKRIFDHEEEMDWSEIQPYNEREDATMPGKRIAVMSETPEGGVWGTQFFDLEYLRARMERPLYFVK
jgi:hypothetical protein